MATEYRYPHESSPAPTQSWLPSQCPLLDSPQADDDGVARGLASSGRMVAYQISDPTYFVTHKFRLPWSEIVGSSGFRAFRDAVLGREFRVKDDLIGAFVTVRFWEYSREWLPVERQDDGTIIVEGAIVMRKV